MQNNAIEPEDWRCHACRKLLGKLQSQSLQIHIDKYRYVAAGSVHCACPKCGAVNSIQTKEEMLKVGSN